LTEINYGGSSAHGLPLGLASRREKTKFIMAAGIGNFLEIFDFTVYSFFAVVIGQVFFKADDPMVSLMISVSVFGVGFLMRPLGSIMIGSYADRYGRKSAMLVTIALMALGSAMIAFAPPYSAIGWLAPLLIVVGRLLQGFSAGGEIGAATTLLMESAPHQERGFFVSWQFIGQGLSSMCGALFGAVLTYSLTAEQLMAWGWRVPFVFSLLIIPVGLYIRAHIKETYAGETPAAHKKTRHPLAQIFNSHFMQFARAVLMVMPVTLLVYIMVFYMPSYLKQVSPVAPSLAYAISAMISVILIVFAFVGGFICDRIAKRKQFAIMIILASLAFAYLVFTGVENIVFFVLALMVCVALLGMLMTTQALLIMEAFPRSVRATAMSVSYSVGVTVFGGTAQIIITKLMSVSGGNPMAPFWYIGPMLLLSVFAYAFFDEKRYV